MDASFDCYYYFCYCRILKLVIMSRFTYISPNLYISNSPLFGNYDKEVIYYLLRSVDINFSTALNIPQFSTCNCMIEYKDNHPMCSIVADNHFIFLHVTDNYWSKWIYQFAHEYCHHLINGKMSGEIRGLMWFEETICELSSMYHLQMAATQWSCCNLIVCRHFAPAHQSYLNGLLSQQPQLVHDTHNRGFLQLWLPILEQQTYHRDYYNALAARMFPLFVENPHLWKIILHFGNMRQWNSLEELFVHLHQTADDSYSDSLKRLENLLFS